MTAISTSNRPPTKPAKLIYNSTARIFSFLDHCDLGSAERVCKQWADVAQNSSNGWELQYERLFKDLPLPEGSSYKSEVRSCFCTMFDADFYDRYLGKVPPAPPIPRGSISHQALKEKDPFDPHQTVGQAYAFVYIPKSIEVFSEEELSKLPNLLLYEKNSPLLSENDSHLRKRAEAFLHILHPDNKPLCNISSNRELIPSAIESLRTIPVNLTTLPQIFLYPKTGNPSTFPTHELSNWNWSDAEKKSPQEWLCMRKKAIQRPFNPEELAAQNLAISKFFPRIFFNLLTYVSSGNLPAFPDDISPNYHVETSTTVSSGDDSRPPLVPCLRRYPSDDFYCNMLDVKLLPKPTPSDSLSSHCYRAAVEFSLRTSPIPL